MKYFELPKSDCKRFLVGQLDGLAVQEEINSGAPPHGIVIFYEDRAAAKAAFEAVTGAHWPEE